MSDKPAAEKKKPQKLGSKKPKDQQQPTPDQSEGDGGAEAGAEAGAEVEGGAQAEAGAEAEVNGGDEAEPEPQQQKSRQASQSRRRQSRGRGRRGGESDSESVARSDASASGGRRQRQRQKKQGGGGGGGGGGPLDDITENVPGGDVVNGAGDMVKDTAGQAVGQATGALGGLTGGGGQKQKGGEEEEEEGKGEQLRLRLELNLDIEIQLKAKIHGDLTLGLLYVFLTTSALDKADRFLETRLIVATRYAPNRRTINVETTLVMGIVTHGVLAFIRSPDVGHVFFNKSRGKCLDQRCNKPTFFIPQSSSQTFGSLQFYHVQSPVPWINDEVRQPILIHARSCSPTSYEAFTS
jgi:hypothetical protein